MTQQEIKEFLIDEIQDARIFIKQKNKKLSMIGSVLNNRIRHYPEEIKEYIKANKIIPYNNKTNIVKIFNIVNDINEYPRCVICGKDVKRFKNFLDGWYDTCCSQCTTMKRYGVKHIMQDQAFKKKFKNIFQHKYGGLGFKSQQLKEKTIETMIEKYGEKYQYQFAKKAKITNQKRYGAEHIMQTEEGVKRYLASRMYNEQFSNIMRLKLTKEKSKKMSEGQRKHKYERLKKRLENKFELLFTFEQYKGLRNHKFNKPFKYKVKCLSCNTIFEMSLVNIEIYDGLNCPGCKVGIRSYIQHRIIENLRKTYSNLTFHEDKIGLFNNRKQIDIYCVEKNLAIEYNGNCWHSQKINNFTKYRHYEKFKLCSERNIDFLAFWSDEYQKYLDRTLIMIDNLLNNNVNVNILNNFNIKECEVHDNFVFANVQYEIFDQSKTLGYIYLNNNILVDFYFLYNISNQQFNKILNILNIKISKLENRFMAYYKQFINIQNSINIEPEYYLYIKNIRSIQTYSSNNYNSDVIWNYGYLEIKLN